MAAAAPANKLTNVEAQRIMAILDETYSKLQMLSNVPPLRRVANYDEFHREVGPEVAQVLDEQVLLEQQYNWVSTPHHEQQQLAGVGFGSEPVNNKHPRRGRLAFARTSGGAGGTYDLAFSLIPQVIRLPRFPRSYPISRLSTTSFATRLASSRACSARRPASPHN